MKREKKVTIGEGFKVRPKMIRMFGRWWKVDDDAWKLLRKLELQEVREKKKVKKLM